MPASEAQINANRQNASRSTGPKTDEGKAASRANALKHGLSCESIAPDRAGDVALAERVGEFLIDLKPTCPTGRALVERAALLSLRMNRCVKQELAATAERVEKALAEFDASRPEGPDPDPRATARARARVADLALFDPSKEASLARRYEAAAERGFFRALREIKALKKAETAPAGADPSAIRADEHRRSLASFRKAAEAAFRDAPAPVAPASATPQQAPIPPDRAVQAPNPPHMNRRQRRAALARRA